MLASHRKLLASPSELLASPSELSASPSELVASPSELLASPSELLIQEAHRGRRSGFGLDARTLQHRNVIVRRSHQLLAACCMSPHRPPPLRLSAGPKPYEPRNPTGEGPLAGLTFEVCLRDLAHLSQLRQELEKACALAPRHGELDAPAKVECAAGASSQHAHLCCNRWLAARVPSLAWMRSTAAGLLGSSCAAGWDGSNPALAGRTRKFGDLAFPEGSGLKYFLPQSSHLSLGYTFVPQCRHALVVLAPGLEKHD
jgi:hypothetical protein